MTDTLLAYTQSICIISYNNSSYYGFPNQGQIGSSSSLQYAFYSKIEDYLNKDKQMVFRMIINTNMNKLQALILNGSNFFKATLYDIIEINSIITTFTKSILDLLNSSIEYYLRPIDGTDYQCKLQKDSKDHYSYSTQNTNVLKVTFSNLNCVNDDADKSWNSYCKPTGMDHRGWFWRNNCTDDDTECPYTKVIHKYCESCSCCNPNSI
uniref:Uncharacterized protein n=1 Tax=viral metagenome TaxID=1070528 RepID=A0A6C0JPW4_9ZZZZ